MYLRAEKKPYIRAPPRAKNRHHLKKRHCWKPWGPRAWTSVLGADRLDPLLKVHPLRTIHLLVLTCLNSLLQSHSASYHFCVAQGRCQRQQTRTDEMGVARRSPQRTCIALSSRSPQPLFPISSPAHSRRRRCCKSCFLGELKIGLKVLYRLGFDSWSSLKEQIEDTR